MLEAVLFTAVAYLIPILLTWWLYASRVSQGARRLAAPSLKESVTLGALLGFSGVQLLVGGHWDASKHIQTGQIPAGADFLWAPHIMIYSSFLISLGVAVFSVASVARDGWARGERDPRQWVRSNPYLGAVAVASVYSLLSIPGDAIWHEIFGVDLTAWSPPHVMLAICSIAVILCGAGVLARVRHGAANPAWINAGLYLLLAVGLQMAHLIATSEWELGPERPVLVLARPIWLYPAVSGAVNLVFYMLARSLVGSRWSATILSLTDLGLRLALMGGLGLSGNVVPMLPLVAVGGAVLMDLAFRAGAPVWAGAAAFTAGFGALALPWIMQRADLHFSGVDSAITLIVSLIMALLLIPVGNWMGGQFRGEGPSRAA